jgi:hypothetical protein
MKRKGVFLKIIGSRPIIAIQSRAYFVNVPIAIRSSAGATRPRRASLVPPACLGLRVFWSPKGRPAYRLIGNSGRSSLPGRRPFCRPSSAECTVH